MFRSVTAGVFAVLVATSVLHAEPPDGVWRNGFEDCFGTGQRIAFASDNGTPIEGWLWVSRCAAPRAPAVVLLHGCSGIYPSSYGDETKISSRFRRWAADLNDLGMHALLVDSFSTRDLDDPPATSRQDYCGARADVVAIHATEEADRPRDAQGSYATLISLVDEHGLPRVDPARVGLLGWSHGGSAALATVARNHWPQQPFATAQIYYPGCGLYNAFGNPNNATSTYVADVPAELQIGTLDMVASVPACSAHAQHSSSAGGAPVVVYAWEGAQHSFDGAVCSVNANGPIVSPWTGLHYICTGTYNGAPFTLQDWNAEINAGRIAACRLRARLKDEPAGDCDDAIVHP